MFTRTALGLTALLLAAGVTTARAADPVPPALRTLKPFQVVEQVMAQREALDLTAEQFARLDDLSLAIRTERHRFVHRGGKPHRTRHVPMVDRQRAYDQVLAILTPDQQTRLQALHSVPATAPRPVRRPTVPRGKP